LKSEGNELLVPTPSIRTRVVVASGVFLLFVAAFLLWAFYAPYTFSNEGHRTFMVSKGQTFQEIVDSLDAHGFIRSPFLFLLVGRLSGGTTALQVGKYEFETGASNNEIYRALRSGKGNLLIQVTLPEGSQTRALAKLFSRQIGADSARFMELAYDEDFARSLGVDSPTLEGYLLPQTYGFYWQQTEEEVIRTQVRQFQQFFVDSLRNRTRELGMSVRQALTLASIVEGEALLDQERPIIAGVYYNRLRKGMRLEADPTIQFVLPDGPRRLLYADLKIESPYNTYRREGLPPGPVNNPGAASIIAALYPVSHGYLYFVANGHGGHWFAKSYAEHVKNVRRYRRERPVASR
jgi:UPF0755 protein